MRLGFFFLMAALFSAGAPGEPLSLESYLSQVAQRHEGVQGARRSSAGAEQQAKEAELAYSPTFFASIALSSDQKPPANPLFGTKTIFDSYSLGVTKLTDFGLLAKLSYNVNYTHIFGVDPAFFPLPSFYDAHPQLELSESLWRNGFGRETRAQVEAAEAQALAQSYTQSFKIKQILLEAELAYWRMVRAKETTRVERETLERAEQLKAWSSRRAGMELADRADVYQADAAYELRSLEVQQAEQEERSAARAFHSLLGEASEQVPEALSPLDPQAIRNAPTPKREGLREDLKAAEEAERAAVANYELALDRNSPSFDLYGSLAYNGHDGSVGPAMGGSFPPNNPTTMVGVKFSAPLDLGLVTEDRKGALKAREGAELTYRRQAFEQDREWDDLSKTLREDRRRLELALAIEAAQQKKLVYEKQRQKRGRSTTFQVLQFEQDFLMSQLSRIQVETEILQILARMKTFGGNA